MIQMKHLPAPLVASIPKVTAAKWARICARFKLARHRVIHNLRMSGMSDPDIATLLGVTTQYLYQSYPRKMGGPKKARKS